jgi:hypothetical protein
MTAPMTAPPHLRRRHGTSVDRAERNRTERLYDVDDVDVDYMVRLP